MVDNEEGMLAAVRDALNERHAMVENLTYIQARCTLLIDESRALRRALLRLADDLEAGKAPGGKMISTIVHEAREAAMVAPPCT